ncbi:replication endonuclease [Aureimonas sp. N4]|uniref:replication endonuclease n=1 Tax=Aureimonas sp. N4 TaxID=1638165 RepID=UPI0009EAABEE|nr:replication endonuclease [Aureimonas sp. N4]
MIPRLDHTSIEPTPPHPSQAKIVDALPQRLGFSHSESFGCRDENQQRVIWLRPKAIAELPFIGRNGRERSARVQAVFAGDLTRGTLLAAGAEADLQTRRHHAECEAFDEGRWAEPTGSQFALDEEELNPDRIADRLPRKLGEFLRQMPEARRRERQKAIVDYVGFNNLDLIGLDPAMLAARAKTEAQRYAARFPGRDANAQLANQQPVHRKGRCEKWQRRRLKKVQRRALAYVEQAVGAVGGANVPGRPLYVSDYAMDLHEADVRRTEEILESLRLICVEDPTVQIPMAEINKRAKAADVAKRRLLMDAMLTRWTSLGWWTVWITITLPGRYVATSTNEGKRAEAWNPVLGPEEASAAIQDMHHRTMALLRERGIRPSGWWNAQPQQSGSPHRHLLLSCPRLEDARAVCDAFWSRFSSTPPEQRSSERRREDPGCSAYVIGDTDPRYAPPVGQNGTIESPESVARYSARYATRLENTEAGGTHGDEQRRFAAWKKLRRVRGHTWVGFDAGRSPSDLWDTLWAASTREGEDPVTPRMRLAVGLMREIRQATDIASIARERAKAAENDDDRNVELSLANSESAKAADLARHACIAVGMWPDRDLDPVELEWLRGETKEVDPLPPMPFRELRETSYRETRSVTVGAVAPELRFVLPERMSAAALLPIADACGVRIDRPSGKSKIRPGQIMRALKLAGFGLSRRPNGTRIGFDLSGEFIRKVEKEWRVVDVETACVMVAEAAANAEAVERMQAEASAKAAMESRDRVKAAIERERQMRQSPEWVEAERMSIVEGIRNRNRRSRSRLEKLSLRLKKAGRMTPAKSRQHLTDEPEATSFQIVPPTQEKRPPAPATEGGGVHAPPPDGSRAARRPVKDPQDNTKGPS